MKYPCEKLLVGFSALLLVGAMLLAGSPAAHAQTKQELENALNVLQRAADRGLSSSGGSTFKTFADDKLEALLTDLGATEVKLVNRNDDRTIYSLQYDGRKMLIGNYRKYGNLQLYIEFKSKNAVTEEKLKKVNEWNRSMRFAKAYLTTEGAWTLDSDLDFGPAVGVDNIKAFFRTYTLLVKQFVDMMKDLE